MKSRNWPPILIFAGINELEGYMKEEPQLYRMLDPIRFEEITLPDDYEQVHEIVASYTLHLDLEVGGDLMTQDFLDRLVVAGAHRWGLVLEITKLAVAVACSSHSTSMNKDPFIRFWVDRTKVSEVSTPFTLRDYLTMFRKDHPFIDILRV